MNSSSNITFEDQYIINRLISLQKQLTYTLLISLWLIGNVGCILNTVIFRRPCLITSSCSRYFLASAFANAFQLNIGLVSNILSFGFGIHPFHNSSLLCKLRNYSINIGGFLSQTYILFACIDRYLISTNKTRYRRVLTAAMANRIIYLLAAFWSVSLSHMLVYSDIAVRTRFCYYSNTFYVVFISVHNLILSGLVFPILMVVFGVLTLRNIRLIRRRARARRRSRHRNHYLSLMLISNVCASVVFTLFYTNGLIYLAYFASPVDSSLKHRVQQKFIAFIATTVYYAQYSISFYVNILTSERFRRELRSYLCVKGKK